MTPDRSGHFTSYLKGAAIFAALFVFASASRADQIIVRSAGGGLELSGRYLGYDGRHIRIETEQGRLTLNYAGLTCEGAVCPEHGVDAPIVRFSGGARLGEVTLPALVEGYARVNGFSSTRRSIGSDVLIYELADESGAAVITMRFHAATTDAGIADLMADNADVLMSGRVLDTEEQIAGLGTLTSPRNMILLAIQAQVPIVSPRLVPGGDALPSISLADVVQAMQGDITNWAQLGGPDVSISLHLPTREIGMTEAFVRDFVQTAGGTLSPNVVFHTSSADVAQAVSMDPGGLGLVPLREVGNAQALGLLDTCGIVGIPSTEAIKTGDYPLSFPLYLYLSRSYQPPEILQFFNWLDTPDAQIILRRAGVQTQSPIPISLAQQGQRLGVAIAAAGPEVGLSDLQSMVAAFEGRARLSPTFRFDEGEQQLDLTSELFVRTLAQAIEAGSYAGQALLLVGFSDSEGAAEVNRLLSETRANAVRDAVVDLLGGTLPPDVQLDTAGFGEALPVGCDDTPWGRQANRRVELWSGPLD